MKQITLHRFRNYHHHTLDLTSAPVVLTGPNGAGKTNILEAVSLLTPGKGLRSARPDQLQHIDSPQEPWALNIRLQDETTTLHIDLGVREGKKAMALDGAPLKTRDATRLAKVFWVTPFMDQLFLEAPSKRRKFLDRLTAFYYPDHLRHLSRLETALRERNRLLRDRGDLVWLSALEEQIARESVIIGAHRIAFLNVLNQSMTTVNPAFPRGALSMKGVVETWLGASPALAVEEKLMHALSQSRSHDALSGTTSLSAHASDFVVFHLDYNRPAELCSTGEQKSVLLSIIMAYTRLCVEVFQQTPILLLDEVVAHLDALRRAALFDEIKALGVQAWMTGTDRTLFDPLEGRAQFLSLAKF